MLEKEDWQRDIIGRERRAGCLGKELEVQFQWQKFDFWIDLLESTVTCWRAGAVLASARSSPSLTSNSSKYRSLRIKERIPWAKNVLPLSPEAALRCGKVLTWATSGPLWNGTGHVKQPQKNPMSAGYPYTFDYSSLYFSLHFKCFIFKNEHKKTPFYLKVSELSNFHCNLIFSLKVFL